MELKDTEIARLEKVCGERGDEVAAKIEEVRDLSRQMNEQKEERRTGQAQAETRCAQLEEAVRCEKARLEELAREFAETTNNLEELNEKWALKTKTNDVKIAELENVKAQREAENAELKNENEKRHQEVCELNEKIIKQTKESQNLKMRVADQARESARVQKERMEQGADMRAQNEKLEQFYQQSCDETKKSTANGDAEIQKLKEELEISTKARKQDALMLKKMEEDFSAERSPKNSSAMQIPLQRLIEARDIINVIEKENIKLKEELEKRAKAPERNKDQAKKVEGYDESSQNGVKPTQATPPLVYQLAEAQKKIEAFDLENTKLKEELRKKEQEPPPKTGESGTHEAVEESIAHIIEQEEKISELTEQNMVLRDLIESVRLENERKNEKNE